MRKGFDTKLIFSAAGALIAFSTGSDSCVEHEAGYQDLMSNLTVQHDASDLSMESKRIVKFSGDLQFVVTEGEEPEAVLGYAPYELKSYASKLNFPAAYDPNAIGAWDQSSFALRVRGEKYVTALKVFYEAMLAGNVAFAGKFIRYDGLRMCGIVLANLSELTEPSDDELLEVDGAALA